MLLWYFLKRSYEIDYGLIDSGYSTRPVNSTYNLFFVDENFNKVDISSSVNIFFIDPEYVKMIIN